MKYTFYVFIFLFICYYSFSSLHEDNKHFVLQGEIIDKDTKKPIPGVRISVLNSKLGAISDKNGKFKIQFSDRGTYELKYNMIGYENKILKLDINKDIFEGIELSSKAVELNLVNVSADKYTQNSQPQSITIISSADLHKSTGQTFGESLKNVPGVTLMQTGVSIAKPVIRGLHSDRLVLVNSDVNQEGQQWGGEHAPEIDPFSSSSIEIIKGASGLEYGPHAIGGVIKVKNSDLPEQDTILSEINLGVFSNNRQYAGSLLISGKTPALANLAWRGQMSYRKAGDAKTPNYNISNTGFDELSYSGEIGYLENKDEISIYYSHFGTELGIFSGAHIHNLVDLQKAMNSQIPLVLEDFSYNIKAPKQNISHDIFKVKGKYTTRLFDFEAIYAFQQNHRQEYDAHTRYSNKALNTPSIDLTLFTHTFDFKAMHYPGKNIISVIGLNGMRQGNIKEGNVMIIPNYRSYSGGIYTIVKYIKENYTLETGIRFDYIWTETFRRINNEVLTNKFDYNNLSFSLGGNFNLNSNWSLSSYLGTAWRPPNLNELFSNDVHHGTARFEIGDMNLKTERNMNFEISLKSRFEKFSSEAGIYSNFIENYIFLKPNKEPVLTIRGAFPSFSFKQTNALISGFDGWLQYNSCDYHFAKVSFAYLIGNNLILNEPLINMPPLQIGLLNHFHLGNFLSLNDNFIEIDVKYNSKQSRVPDNSDYLPPPSDHTLINLNLGTNFQVSGRNVQINLSANNLLNKSYRDYLSRFRYFIDEPGVNFIFRAFIQI
jgi:iron complex outermembrane receptor protein